MKIKLIIFAIFLVIVAAFFIPNLFYGRQEEIGTTQKSQTELKPTASPSLKDVEKLISGLNEIILKENARFGIEVYELKTGWRFGINQEEIFHAASVGKVLVAAYSLRQVDQGKISLSQVIEGVPFREHLRLMINRSDNNSWEILLKFFGYAKIHQLGRDLGLSKTSVFENTTTAKDVNDLLVKIYQGNLLKEDSRDLLFSWMQNTEREERIPQAVPKGTVIYHKAGTFEGETHDAAIVLHPKNPFVLTILSQAKYDTSRALREITRSVYDFFNN